MAQAKRDPDRDASDMRFQLLAALTRLRQLCCHPRLVYPRSAAGSAKAAYLLELLAELKEGGHRVLVFSQFRSFLDLLAPRLRQHGFRVLVLDGTTPAEAREERIAAFQSGAADAFLISLKAGGFGLNLTAADTVIHLDPWWNPAVEDQATARAHRIGQQKPVTAVRLVARGTIEEAVLGLHADKRALAASILDGADLAASLTTDDLVALINAGLSR
jgi:SNF2 family DNA or RNA helicase